MKKIKKPTFNTLYAYTASLQTKIDDRNNIWTRLYSIKYDSHSDK